MAQHLTWIPPCMQNKWSQKPGILIIWQKKIERIYLFVLLLKPLIVLFIYKAKIFCTTPAFTLLSKITPFTFFIWTFSKNENEIAYIEVKLEKKTFEKKFPEILVSCLQFQCIWALKFTNISLHWNIGKINNIKKITSEQKWKVNK